MTDKPQLPKEILEYLDQAVVKEDKSIKLIRDLMPQKDYKAVKKFIDKFSQVLNMPYEQLNCGCMYMISENKVGFQTWVFIAQCPICKINEGFHSHRPIHVI